MVRSLNRKRVAMLLVIAMTVSLFSVTALATNKNSEEYESIPIETIESVALAFINARSNYSGSDIFEVDSVLKLEVTMYDLENKPSAYRYSVNSKSGDYEGYIILGANEKYAPIIEYGFGDEPLNVKFASEQSVIERVYYTGGIDFFVQVINEKDDETYTDFYNNTVALEALPINSANSAEDFSKDWDAILECVEVEDRGNTRNDPEITDPGTIVPGFERIQEVVLTVNDNVEFSVMDDYPTYQNHCGPVAALNYFKFELHGNEMSGETWDSLFKTIRIESEHSNLDGTNTSYLAEAINKIWEDKKYRDRVVWASIIDDPSRDFSYISIKAIYNMISGAPSILLVNGSKIYEDHFVFAYGWQRYAYNSITRDFFRIADGHSSEIRYIMAADDLVSVIQQIESM